MTDKPSIDPRVARTKQRLFNALLDLIQTRRWEKIRVQDVLDATSISRSAFYAHFENKYDLLTSGMPEVVLPKLEHNQQPDLVPLFAHIDDMAAIMRPLMTQPILSEIVDSFHLRFVTTWEEHLANTQFRDDPVLPEMMAGALTAAVRSYALTNQRDDPMAFAGTVMTHFDRLLRPDG